MSRRTKVLLWVSVALVAWFAVTLRWATQPLSDSIPVGKDKDLKVVVVTVECGTVFDSDPMGGNPVPPVVTPPAVMTLIENGDTRFVKWALPREPCTLVHNQAQVLFGINVVVFLLGAAAIGVVATRTRRPPIAQMATAAFT